MMIVIEQMRAIGINYSLREIHRSVRIRVDVRVWGELLLRQMNYRERINIAILLVHNFKSKSIL